MSIQDQIQTIKTQMPETYKAIQAKAAAVGNEAYALVKRGLRGEPNCFWSMEAGWVMGTPFDQLEISRDIAWAMVQFGAAHVCIFQLLPAEVNPS